MNSKILYDIKVMATHVRLRIPGHVSSQLWDTEYKPDYCLLSRSLGILASHWPAETSSSSSPETTPSDWPSSPWLILVVCSQGEIIPSSTLESVCFAVFKVYYVASFSPHSLPWFSFVVYKYALYFIIVIVYPYLSTLYTTTIEEQNKQWRQFQDSVGFVSIYWLHSYVQVTNTDQVQVVRPCCTSFSTTTILSQRNKKWPLTTGYKVSAICKRNYFLPFTNFLNCKSTTPSPPEARVLPHLFFFF